MASKGFSSYWHFSQFFVYLHDRLVFSQWRSCVKHVGVDLKVLVRIVNSKEEL